MANRLEIEVYGIPETVWRCPGCKHVTDILKTIKVPYKFYPVLLPGPSGPIYDKPLIVELAKRIKSPTLNIRYPVIFINGERHKIASFKSFLISLGFDPDDIED